MESEEQMGSSAEQMDAGDTEEMEGEESNVSVDMDVDAEADDTPDDDEDGTKPLRPNFKDGDDRDRFNYNVFTRENDEVANAPDLCDAEELTRLRAYLDHQLQGLQGAVSKLANKLQRRLMAQQNRSWSFDLEEGVLDTARLTRVITDPTAPLSFKQEDDSEFRFHARPADHGGGAMCGHSGPHTGALRRENGDPRLYDKGVEGWPFAGGLGQGRQARRTGAPE
jgi:cobaltochelatase CobT